MNLVDWVHVRIEQMKQEASQQWTEDHYLLFKILSRRIAYEAGLKMAASLERMHGGKCLSITFYEPYEARMEIAGRWVNIPLSYVWMSQYGDFQIGNGWRHDQPPPPSVPLSDELVNFLRLHGK